MSWGSCSVSIRVSVVIRSWSQPTVTGLAKTNLVIRCRRLSRSEGNLWEEFTGGNYRGSSPRWESPEGKSPIPHNVWHVCIDNNYCIIITDNNRIYVLIIISLLCVSWSKWYLTWIVALYSSKYEVVALVQSMDCMPLDQHKWKQRFDDADRRFVNQPECGRRGNLYDVARTVEFHDNVHTSAHRNQRYYNEDDHSYGWALCSLPTHWF